jgi:hypothetical protein
VHFAGANVIDWPEKDHCFQVITPKRTLTVQALSAQDKADWLQAIRNNIAASEAGVRRASTARQPRTVAS